MGVVYKMLIFHDMEHGKGGGTGQMVATECGAELSVDRGELGRDEQRRHGEAVGDAFGHCDEVRTDAEPLMGEELAAAAVAALYLVADEQGLVFGAGCAERLSEIGLYHPDAAHALDALDDAGAHVAFGQLGLPGGDVVDGQVGDVMVGVDGGDDFRVVGHFDGERGAAVEGFLCREHPCAPVVERGEFEGVLIGLGSTVDEKQLIVLVSTGCSEPLGELLLKTVDDGVGVETQLVHLLGDGLHIAGVAVPDADDGMASVEVEVFGAVLIPHLAAFASHDVDVEKRIDIV